MEYLPSGPGIATTVETPLLTLVDLPAPLLAKILGAVGVCDAHRVAAATATIMRDGLVQHVRAWLPATRQLSWRDALKAGVQQEDREGPLWRALPSVRALAATLAAGGAPTAAQLDALGYFKHSVQARGGELIPLLDRSDVVAMSGDTTPDGRGAGMMNDHQYDAIDLAARLMWLKNGNVDKIPIVKCALVELLAHELLCNHLYARVITEEEAIEQGLPYE